MCVVKFTLKFFSHKCSQLFLLMLKLFKNIFFVSKNYFPLLLNFCFVDELRTYHTFRK